jgi:hypothetical protein
MGNVIHENDEKTHVKNTCQVLLPNWNRDSWRDKQTRNPPNSHVTPSVTFLTGNGQLKRQQQQHKHIHIVQLRPFYSNIHQEKGSRKKEKTLQQSKRQ